ncbi:sulfite exporter TauE/SafE family protein [Fodinibius salsisoli]|uniref:Sulfite exporter TauE/SafE family protein n=1 Tax=Fodinibius salsisoli TaxID=2820877 RepID=A0ABT3PN67_9BACT|nr:sulfite exporter TauE/SafE family protein [Fodinibius salsisoli]MCW9707290.1 sulfite exporter TauE/SafE family protein [Fodinibius salsisoli]
METWTALAIGFFGSFHCIGMCGPIALALPGQNDSKLFFISGRLLYNIGRIVTYSLLGALFGVIGYSIMLAKLQNTLSIFLGILIILGSVSQTSFFQGWKKKMKLNLPFQKLKKLINSQFNKRGQGTLFTIGLLNGLLPCGFVYIALAGSITTGSIVGGSIFMALFGLGTLPAMFAMALAPGMISLQLRRKINTILPLLAAGLGIYLIYRGIM